MSGVGAVSGLSQAPPVGEQLTGIGVCAGLAIGPVARMAEPAGMPPPRASLPEAERSAACEHLAAAVEAVRAELDARAARAVGEAAEVLTMTALMAADPVLATAARARVTDDGLHPELAVWHAAGEVEQALSAAGGYIGERARDVRDVRDRLVAELAGRRPPGVPSPEHPFVLVAHDLAPADTATLDAARVLAIVTAGGGPTSHTAILARSLGIPAVVAAAGAGTLTDDLEVLVDGAAGTVRFPVTDADRAAHRSRATRPRPTFDGHGRTADGVAVALMANVGDPAGAGAAAAARAEGIGLFRTEFCFLDRGEAPTLAEQVETYTEVLTPFAGRRVVVRTLDAGADKPLPFLSSPDAGDAAPEPNPALGVRGLRVARARPGLLHTQLAAIAEAAERSGAQVWVMAPMVSTAPEAEEFVAACEAQGLAQAGVMIEVPGAALTADAVLRHARFASIGTNDLSQYTMAADRELAPLAELQDPFQPAVLRLIELTCREGARLDRPVGVCGEAAADPVMACVLVGLGVSSLSMSAGALGEVGAALAAVPLAACREAAAAAVQAGSASAARAAAMAELPAPG